MNRKIVYVAPNNKVFTYNITSEIKYQDNTIKFFDEVTNELITLPLDRCQIREVQ